MFLTVTLNPTIDKTFLSHNFQLNRLNRAEVTQTIAGGKGINASVVLSLLGEEVIATGFLGGLPGRNVGEYLRSKNITTSFAPIEGSTRTNYIFQDNTKITQVNEQGPLITPEELQSFLDIYDRLLSQSDFVIIAGSVPPGINHDIYNVLIKKAKRKEIDTFLNASGKPLENALESAPTIVKPDIRTGQKVLGENLDSIKNKIKVGTKLISYGTKISLFSEGEAGQLIITKEKAIIASPKKETVKSRIGVQDSIIGAFSYAIKNNLSLKAAAKMAVCAGQAAANTIANTPRSSSDIEKCEPSVNIKEVGA